MTRFVCPFLASSRVDFTSTKTNRNETSTRTPHLTTPLPFKNKTTKMDNDTFASATNHPAIDPNGSACTHARFVVHASRLTDERTGGRRRRRWPPPSRATAHCQRARQKPHANPIMHFINYTLARARQICPRTPYAAVEID